MKWSQAFIPTLKESPAEAEIPSHRLMLRAGLMRKLSAGVYSVLPLGWRVIHKVMEIIREEHDRAGAQEVLLPVLHPAELWQETGRWEQYGPLLMRLIDRSERPFALGPTHEEVITDLIRREVRSYRELPLILYQIQTKFRDEVRPRFGVMRAREFIMKDAYSFHADQASLDETYRLMYEVYSRIFWRCGFDFRAVEAHSGAIGGAVNHEFVTLAEMGDAEILACVCGYAATTEQAAWGGAPEVKGSSEKPEPLEKRHTPEKTTVEEVAEFLGVTSDRLVKTILFEADGEAVAVLVRGDRQVNEGKVWRHLGVNILRLAEPPAIREWTGASMGFSGPVGLDAIPVLADYSVKGLANFVTGANEDDHHLVNVNFNRDFTVREFGDFVQVQGRDPCARCGEPLESVRGIELGHIFDLGEKYSRAMDATFLDDRGNRRHFLMGCYGIGVTRIVAAVIEQHHDEDGIRWPITIAPYQVQILSLGQDDDEVGRVADRIYRELDARGLEVLLDDRDERPGPKFKDADLIGIPLRVVAGEQGLKDGEVEIGWRGERGWDRVSLGGAVDEIESRVRSRLQELGPERRKMAQTVEAL